MRDEALDKPTEVVIRQAQDEGPRLQNGAARPICPGYLEFDRATSLGHVVNRLARLLRAHGTSGCGPKASRSDNFGPLLILWDREGVSQSETARRHDVEQPTIAAPLSRMQRDGPLAPAADLGNRRQAPIFLTGKGRAVQPEPTREARAAIVAAAAADPTRSEPERSTV